MAQHLNPNQVQHLGMLQGLNFTILNQQPSHIGQAFGQQGHQGMYQIVQQVQPGQHQVQLQNVQQFNNQFHHIMQPQQFNSQQQILLQQQLPQQIQQTQQIQQQTHQQIQHHQPVQQQQIQSNNTPSNKGSKNKNNNSNNTNISNDNQELTKSGKKKKKAPVPNKDGVLPPKRATTAYINFTQFYREQIKKSGRTVPKIGEFGKECASKWNAMSDEEKKPFTDEANKDRERYRKEMEIFKPQRDNNKPKRPGTAFMLFMVDFRKELAGKEPEGGVAALAKLGGERWRSMTDEDKKPYVEQQNECKVVYEAQMEEYRKLTGQPPVPGKPSNNNTSKANSTSVKSEDSNASEHLNNSMSNSNISNVDHLNNHEDLHQNHNSQSPGSTSPHNNVAQQAMSPDAQSLQSIATGLSLQSQPYYTTPNSFMSATFLDQPHEDAAYGQTIDQPIHDGQEQNEQQVYLNGQQAYHNYSWN